MKSNSGISIIIGVLVIEHLGVLARNFTRDVRVYHSFNVKYVNTTRNFDVLMTSFGFVEDGEFYYSMQCPKQEPEEDAPEEPARLWLLLCSTAEARALFRMSFTQISQECRKYEEHRGSSFVHDDHCHTYKVNYNASSYRGVYSLAKRLKTGSFYSILLLQCPSSRAANFTKPLRSNVCKSTVIALNPGRQHLSSDEIPLPMFYTILNMVWAALVTIWFFNGVLYCKYSNQLHRLIVTVPVLKVLHVLLQLLWWQEVANEGVPARELSTLCNFVKSAENALLFTIILIIAEGWGVVRCRFKFYKWPSFLLLFLTFTTSMLCVYWLHRYFMAFSILLVVFMMYKALKWTSSNIDHLRRCRRKHRRFLHRLNLHYCGTVTVDQQIVAKLVLFRRFRIACATFSLAFSIAVTLSTFLQEYAYVRAILFEAPELFIYVVIGWLFRLRNFEPYSKIELVPPKENVMIVELPEVCYGYAEHHFMLGVPVTFKVEKETQTPRRRWGRSL